MAAIALVAVIGIGVAIWVKSKPTGPGDGFVSGNGRVEATDIDIATKLAGPIQDILVNEGDFVQPGQLLAEMRVDGLLAQRDEARAKYRHDVSAIDSAEAKVAALQSYVAAQQATDEQRQSDLELAQQKLRRNERLVAGRAVSQEDFDITRADFQSAKAALAAAKAQVVSAQAAVKAAAADVLSARASAVATKATIARVEADIQDGHLKAPRGGRIQYRIAQPGEVLAGGGKVLNLVDLNDVYMTFYLPETVVGKVPLGAEVRLVLDAAPQYVIPAKISYISSLAQFTPKTVETASERQKLMFRVKAQIDLEVLRTHLKMVKTGLPGVAWVKIDPDAVWPANLEIKVPQ
ncbi:MAG: HlyD family secretion protein [Gemmataceae bacterium]